MPLFYLAGSLEVDLEDDVLAGRGVGQRCAVEMAEELRPFEKPVSGDLLLELGSIDEGVRVVRFAGALRTRGP